MRLRSSRLAELTRRSAGGSLHQPSVVPNDTPDVRCVAARIPATRRPVPGAREGCSRTVQRELPHSRRAGAGSTFFSRKSPRRRRSRALELEGSDHTEHVELVPIQIAEVADVELAAA